MNALRLVVLSSLLLLGCNDFSGAIARCQKNGGCGAGTTTDGGTDGDAGTLDGGSTLDGGTGSPVRISPKTARLVFGSTEQFAGGAGVGRYLFAVVDGGGTITSEGLYTAPSVEGPVVVRLTDSAGTFDEASIDVRAPVLVVDAGAVGGIPTPLQATGGFPPYSWLQLMPCAGEVVDGGWLLGDADGGSCRVQATDSANFVSPETDVVFPPELSLSPAQRTIAVNNTLPLTVRGGRGPYTFDVDNLAVGVVNAGSFVPVSTGVATVRVLDAVGGQAKSVITVNPSLGLVPASTQAVVGTTVTFTPDGGAGGPYTWSATLGAIDGGVYFATTPGNATVTVKDSMMNVADATVTVVTRLTLSPDRATLAPGNNLRFEAQGGVPPYTFGNPSCVPAATSCLFTAPSGTGPFMVTVSDTSNQSATAQVIVRSLFSTPARSFQGGAGADGLAVARWNADAVDDLVVTNSNTAAVTLLLGQPDASMPALPSFSGSGTPHRPIVGDFNGDGRLDIAAGGGAGVMLALRQPDGGVSSSLLISNGSTNSVAAMDWSGDGQLDLVAPQMMGSKRWTWMGTNMVASDTNFGGPSAQLIATNLNDAGMLDLVYARDTMDVLPVLSDTMTGHVAGTALTIGRPLSSVVAGDWTRDGTNDLAVAINDTGADAVWLFVHKGLAGFSVEFQPPVKYAVTGPIVDLAAGDLDHDGWLDLVALNGTTGAVTVLRGTSLGVLQPGGTYASGSGSPNALVLGDFNGDTKLDVATCGGAVPNSVSVLYNALP